MKIVVFAVLLSLTGFCHSEVYISKLSGEGSLYNLATGQLLGTGQIDPQSTGTFDRESGQLNFAANAVKVNSYLPLVYSSMVFAHSLAINLNTLTGNQQVNSCTDSYSGLFCRLLGYNAADPNSSTVHNYNQISITSSNYSAANSPQVKFNALYLDEANGFRYVVNYTVDITSDRVTPISSDEDIPFLPLWAYPIILLLISVSKKPCAQLVKRS